MIEITLEQARTLQINALGLGQPKQKNAEPEDLLNIINGLGLIQIDTIHIVARSHYFVLWSRLGEYPQSWLDDLLSQGQLFEYWAHAACLIPIQDFPLFRAKMLIERDRITDTQSWFYRNSDFIQQILSHIRQNGPVKSSEFKHCATRGGTWWDWKAEKSALEQLYDIGELMIARREKFQRVYDLTERIYPQVLELEPFSPEIVKKQLVERTIKILGIALPEWVPDYYRIKKTGILELLNEMLTEGVLLQVKVGNWEKPTYIHRDQLPTLDQIADNKISADTTHILSPFDPLVWDRNRLKTLFGMEYQIECYLPASKRKFGYWILPILHKDTMIGRMDVKANRQNRIFEVKSIFLDTGITITEELITDLAETLITCASWHHTPSVNIDYVNDEKLKLGLLQKIQNHTDQNLANRL